MNCEQVDLEPIEVERFQVKVNKQKVCPPHTTAIPRLVWNLCLDLDSPP